LAIISAFIIALVKPLKALFMAVDGWTGTRILNAPDGQPPLAFIMDTATFVGGASVPIGLTCLGSALARLKVPKGQWRNLPLGAISSIAVARLIVIPVIGVLMCQGLTSAGVIDENDKVLRFVCMYVLHVSASLYNFKNFQLDSFLVYRQRRLRFVYMIILQKQD
jgi:auxin efflux carrier family protein